MQNSPQKISLVEIIVVLLIALGISIVIFAHFHKPQTVGNFNPTGGGTYLLQNSISATQSTLTLTSFTEPGSGIPYTMSYINTDIIYGTIAPSSGRSEFVSASGITQNANGTATLTGLVRGLSRTPGSGGCVASSTLATGWSGQTQFILSNSPCFYSEYIPKRSNATSSAILTFGSTTAPRYDVDPGSAGFAAANPNIFVNYAQLVRTALAGTVNASESVNGVVELATDVEQASSTSIGSTGASVVLQAKNATSSPGSAGLWTVITNNAGKIAQAFIDFGQATTWTALHTFTGGLTSTGTTTISASSLTTNPLIINTVTYKWPSAQGAANKVLLNDGSGNLSWGTAPNQLNSVGATGVSLSDAGFATSSTQLVLAAGVLTASSTIEIIGGGQTSTGSGSSASTCNIFIKDSTGKTLNSFSSVTATADGSASRFTYHAYITMPSTTAAQNTYISGIAVDAGIGAGSGVAAQIDTLASTAINFANALTLTVVAQETVASKNCSLTNVQYIVNL